MGIHMKSVNTLKDSKRTPKLEAQGVQTSLVEIINKKSLLIHFASHQ